MYSAPTSSATECSLTTAEEVELPPKLLDIRSGSSLGLKKKIIMLLGSSIKYFIIQNHRLSPTIWPPELKKHREESKYTLEFLKIERV